MAWLSPHSKILTHEATTSLSWVLGKPQFIEAHLANTAIQKGNLAAWIEAVMHDAVGAASRVKGDFAVGLYLPDGRTFLAVDRFAIQTLCYRVVEGQLRFAARADALADTPAAIDPQAIFDYLYFHVIPSPRTIYKDIYRLPPGHYALFENGQLTVAPYWTPAFAETPNPDFPALQDEFKHLLRNAVARQLDGNKPACFLSGGTDSSTVVGMAALASGQPVASYSIGFDVPGYDEMDFAQLAAQHFKTEHHAYYVTPDDLVQSIPKVAAYFDQPFGNSSALPAYYCAKMAHEAGVNKLLAGDGGDELFGGNTRYAKTKVFGLYDTLPKVLQKNLLEPLLGSRAASAWALTRKAASYVEQARVPMPDRLQMYNLIMRLGPSEVLTPALLAYIDTASPLQLQRAVWHRAQDGSSLNRELAFDWRFTLAESDLPKVRGATGLAGIDVGFPLLDDDLLAFSLKLPTSYKLKGLQLRWFFQEARRSFLPDEIIRKKKQGFGLPFGVWAKSHPALKSLATASLNSLVARHIIRADFVDTLLTRHLQEHPGYYGEMIWLLMMLEQWLQHHAPVYRLT